MPRLMEYRLRPPLAVKFFDLEPVDDRHDSHRHRCPLCSPGLLLMDRSWPTLELAVSDRCPQYVQRYIYRDIDRVRRERP